MVRETNPLPATTRNQKLLGPLGYAIILVVAVRTLLNIAKPATFDVFPALVILLLILSLYASEPVLTRHMTWYPYLYTLLYTCLALALGLQQPYFDMWGALFLALSVQVVHFFPRRIAIGWLLLYTAIVILGLTLTLGVAGFTTSLTMIAGAAALVSFDLLYTQAEVDRRASYKLLADLQDAHNKLLAYARQVEELSATQERNRLARELHDSINQDIFSMTLNAQAARVMLDKDPARVPAQLDQLQEMTGNTLVKLRSLITQLRPPQAGA
jgi:signal transduction histidine kinase